LKVKRRNIFVNMYLPEKPWRDERNMFDWNLHPEEQRIVCIPALAHHYHEHAVNTERL
jgi:hypothetical protein